MPRRLTVAGLRVLIGAVFIYAGQAKMQATADFAESIAAFRLLPAGFSNLIAMGLPPFEILLGLWLIVGWRRRPAAFCALLTSGIFLLALVSASARGIAVDCGCFGPASGALSPTQQLWLSIGRDLLLLGATAIVYIDAVPGRLRARHERP